MSKHVKTSTTLALVLTTLMTTLSVGTIFLSNAAASTTAGGVTWALELNDWDPVYDFKGRMSGPGDVDMTFQYDISIINVSDINYVAQRYSTVWAVPKVYQGGVWQAMDGKDVLVASANISSTIMRPNMTYAGQESWLVSFIATPLFGGQSDKHFANESLFDYFMYHPAGAPDTAEIFDLPDSAFSVNLTWANGDFYNNTYNATGIMTYQNFNLTQMVGSDHWGEAILNLAEFPVATMDVSFGVTPGENCIWYGEGFDGPGTVDLKKIHVTNINMSYHGTYGWTMPFVWGEMSTWNQSTNVWDFDDPGDPEGPMVMANSTFYWAQVPFFLPDTIKGVPFTSDLDYVNKSLWLLFEDDAGMWDAYDPGQGNISLVTTTGWKIYNPADPYNFVQVNWTSEGVLDYFICNSTTMNIEASLWGKPGIEKHFFDIGAQTYTFSSQGNFKLTTSFSTTANVSLEVEFLSNNPVTKPMPTKEIGYFVVTANDTAAISSQLTFTVEYLQTIADTKSVAEINLTWWYYNISASEWQNLSSTVDTAANTVTGNAAHLSTFCVGERVYVPPSAPQAPVLDLPTDITPPDAGEAFDIPAGKGQTTSFSDPTSGVSVGLKLNTTKPVKVSVGVWTENPATKPAGFKTVDGKDVAVYFAIDVNDTTAITFPIIMTITLPTGIDASMTADKIADALKIVTWDEDAGKWTTENFDIVVDKTAGTAIVTITHLSVFALGINEPTGFDIPSFSPTLGILAALGATLLLIARKRRV